MTQASLDVKAALLMLGLVACRPDAVPAGTGEKEVPQERPRAIRALPIPVDGALEFDASLLPHGARGKFPSFDGDSFAVTIAPRSGDPLTPRRAFEEIVAPLMRAMGFASRVRSMTIPDEGQVYQQVESGVAIEQAVVVVTQASIHGTLFNRYRVMNVVRLSGTDAIDDASKDLSPLGRAVLVLLPYGAAPDRSIALRYAYRALLVSRDNAAHTWMAWIDADTGSFLQLTPQFEQE